MSAQAQSTLKR